MELCSCGEIVEIAGGKCSRCVALQTLGLESGATEAEIKAAYKMLVKVWHPDRFPGDEKLREAAQERLQAINLAYQQLSSVQPGGRSRFRARRPPPEPNSSAPAPAPPHRSGKPGYRQGILRSLLPVKALVIPALVLGGIGFLGWLVLPPLDTMMSSAPLAGPVYREYKVRVIGRWQAMVESLPELMGRHRSEPQTAAQTLPAAEAEGNEERSAGREPAAGKPAGRQPAVRSSSAPASPAKARVLPYVTTGLMKSEVIETLGTPSSETEDKLIYGYSELDFSNGSLAGWKIDARSPLRVKLWPETRVDPDLDAFWIGSSKSEVVAIEGTPTLLTENTFGYGRSEVYFQNGRVVSWKNDPASTFLRARPR